MPKKTKVLPNWTFSNVGTQWEPDWVGHRDCGTVRAYGATWVVVLARAVWKEDEIQREDA